MQATIVAQIGYVRNETFGVATKHAFQQVVTDGLYASIGMPFIEQWERRAMEVGRQEMEQELWVWLQLQQLEQALKETAEASNPPWTNQYVYDFDAHAFIVEENVYRIPNSPMHGFYAFRGLYPIHRPTLLQPSIAWHIQEELKQFPKLSVYLRADEFRNQSESDKHGEYMMQQTHYFLEQTMRLVIAGITNKQASYLAEKAVHMLLDMFPEDENEAITAFMPFHPVSERAISTLSANNNYSGHVLWHILTIDEWYNRFTFRVLSTPAFAKIFQHQRERGDIIGRVFSFFRMKEVTLFTEKAF